MRFLEGGTELVDPEAALGQTSRAREDELGQERAPVGLDDDAVVRIFHLDVAGVHRCLLFFFFFTLSFSILLGRKDACAVDRVSGCLYPARRAARVVTGCKK